MIAAAIAAEPIDTSRVTMIAGPTAHQEILLGSDGERVFPAGGYHAGVLAVRQLESADLAVIASADALHIPVFRQLDHLWRQVRALPPGPLRAVDLLDGADLGEQLEALPAILGAANIVFLGGDAALLERVAPIAAAGYAASGVIMVVTLGAGGSVAFGGERIVQPAMPVPKVVDTTGAGDAFQAAFLVSFVAQRDIAAALRGGAASAATAIVQLGA